MLGTHQKYMQRCLQLAQLGEGYVAPNPMVGAVLVYEDEIIGEGYHQQYGQAHAEVNCINSVADDNKNKIPFSTLYVSLEPCSHFGKTPPCVDLILQQQIKKVVVACRDSFKKVNGNGIQKLQAADVEVIENILQEECTILNKRFFTFNAKKRPYIILKWAETSDGKIANLANDAAERLFISNDFTNRIVHHWRSQEAAILVGTNTALLDNPSLNNRLWHSKQPTRLVLDMHLRLPSTLHIFNQQQPTIIFNASKEGIDNNLMFYKLQKNKSVVQQMLHACYTLGIQSILVEGGAAMLQSFIDEQIWDEARVIKNDALSIGNGLEAPIINAQFISLEKFSTDTIYYYLPA
jgi:diaminohydroxyphosphoribosylaminopyrimidine deaminase / 5-amino-6-(5-phosphoribosylamino)uracil reductase